MDLLEDLRLSLIEVNFLMISIVHKILVLLKNHLNYLKVFSNKEYNFIFLFFFFIFFTTYSYEKSKTGRRRRNYNIRNFFRIKKELNNIAIKNIRALFRLGKETKAIKDRILRDIMNIFQYGEDEESYYKVRVSNFWSSNYIDYENNGDRDKVAEYLHKIRTYLKDHE